MTGTRRQYLAAGGAVLAVGVAGCSGTEREYDEVTITEFVFSAEEPEGYGDYEERDDDTFEQGEKLWFYVGVGGARLEDGEFELTLDVSVDPPGEYPEQSSSDEFGQEVDDDEDPDKLFLAKGYETTSRAPTGEWEVTAVVTDENDDDEDNEVTDTFTVESA